MAGYDVREAVPDVSLVNAYAVRRAVFIDEQGVSETEEMDGLDAEAIHFVAYDETDGRPVGTTRLRNPDPGVAKIERVAVLAAHRENGLGRRLMAAAESAASRRDWNRALLHAQTAVEPFYVSLGYDTVSDEFDEAGIPHVKMEKSLP